jgi:hypothetical protein
MPTQTIERVNCPTIDDFQANFVARKHPVVICGAMEGWPEYRRWTPEHLVSLLGSTPVTIARSPSRNYFDPETGTLYEKNATLPFDRFADEVFGRKVDGGGLYLKFVSVDDLPALKREVTVPTCMRTRLRSSNFWIGSRGNVTRCHYDLDDNLLCQVRGSKFIKLFPADQLARMYPRSPLSKKSNFSRVDVMAPDLARYPRFARAESFETTLHAGEILYIPVHWFHYVESLDPSISINHWFEVDLRHSLDPAALRYFPRMLLDGYLSIELLRIARLAVGRNASQ